MMSLEHTAVDEFSDALARGTLPPAGRYARRIPTQLPAVGEQFAFEVDLDACTGCKACVTACHSLNGLDDGEVWRQVGIFDGLVASKSSNELAFSGPALVHVTTACHHCADPGCLRGCPVNAYEKNLVTGAVVHLDDQCIGCSYCTMTCPYEVPRLNERLGVVRKCDMCTDRLVVGEEPACVQGCPNAAIRITTVSLAETKTNSTGSKLVPGSAPSRISQPTTVFRTRRSLPEPVPGDVVPSPSHWPLVVMLVSSQLASGAALAVIALPPASITAHLIAASASVFAVGASFAHLGRPLLAWRVVLGLGHSWLSREAVLLGAFAGATTASLALHLDAEQPGTLTTVRTILAAVAALLGIGVLLSSVMVYTVTGRTWWSKSYVYVRFGCAVGSLGLACWGLNDLGRVTPPPSTMLAVVAAIALAGVSLSQDLSLARRGSPSGGELARTGLLISGPLRRTMIVRVLFVGASSLAMFDPAPLRVAGFVALLIGTLAERSLFFRAVAPNRMPGWQIGGH